MKTLLAVIFLFLGQSVLAQDAIPKAQTKAERKAARKKMTLEERIEDVLPVDVSLPSAKVNVPGGKEITSIEEAKSAISEGLTGAKEKGKELKVKGRKAKKAVVEAKARIFDGKQYQGIAVQKQIYKRGSGSRMRYIEFYTLKDFQKPSIYTKSLFWYDEKTRRIVEAISRDRKTNHLMHGPYREYRGDNLIKEGFYYLGALDGRWETYDSDFILLDKMSYSRGFFVDSEISYFDETKEKLEEVIPMLYGKKTGEYYQFYEGGTLAVEGQYDDGVKIGRWIEYYDSGNRRKTETQYPKDCYDKTEAIVLRQYSEDGKMIFEHESLKRM